ncbi:MAG TPA: MerR family transcriptional regulator [Candidatus Baltobacteraceae bacterium]|nr:MerR family transcriptional regulator [Candidatus Baltobacteraceae bacterium]
MDTQELFSIGELSKRCGVPVKTIRHYADEGVVPPSATSDAGYRMYTQADARRLMLVRNLRALGFSLEAISSMLDGSRDPEDVAALQLELVQTQLRALERQRSILQAAATLRSRDDVVRQLDAAYAAASLGAAERTNRLEQWLAKTRTVESGEASRAKIRAMVLDGLPDELSIEQLAAWVRLSALLDDPGLLETLRLQHQPFADAFPSEEEQMAFGSGVMQILSEAYSLLAEGAAATDERAQALADRWASHFALALGCQHNADFPEWFAEYARRTNDPRIERFWNDVAVLRGTPPMPPFTQAQALLIEAYRAR